MSFRELKIKIELDYLERKSKYDMECELLKIQREQFYRKNPSAPPYMYMQVVPPPMKIEIKEV